MGNLDPAGKKTTPPTAVADKGPTLTPTEQEAAQKRAAAARADADAREAEGKAAQEQETAAYERAVKDRAAIIKANGERQKAIDQLTREIESANRTRDDLAMTASDLLSRRSKLDREMRVVPPEPKKPKHMDAEVEA